MAYSPSLLLGFIVLIQIICLLCKAKIIETPQVLLIGGTNSFYYNETWIYNLTDAQKKELQLSCISEKPIRWGWKIEDSPKTKMLTKERQTFSKSTKQTKFVSNLTINLISNNEPVDTNFSCSTDWGTTKSEADLNHNVTCVQLFTQGLEPIQLHIFYGKSFKQCLQIERSSGRNCTKDLIIDLKNSRGACKKQKDCTTNIKTTRCEDLDTCENNVDFNLMPHNRHISCGNETFGSINSTDQTIVFNNTAMFPLIVYCEKAVDNGWSSFIFLYPSFNETWERLSYFKTVEDARHNKSVELIALQHGQTSLTQINDLNRRKQFAVGEVVTFVCVAVKYLFMSNFQWTIANKSDFHASDEIDKEVTSMVSNGTLNQYLHLVPKNILMNATTYGKFFTVSCHVPVWNSKTYLSSKINVSLSPAVSPNTTLICKEDEKNVNCSCQYSGWPKPQITWDDKVLNHSSVVEIDTHVPSETIDPDQRNWSHNKTFLKVETTARDIKCIARNFAGNATAVYTTGKAPSSILSYVIGFSLLTVCILVLVIVAMYWRYRKKLILYAERQNDLSNEEIDEFYTGASLSSTTYDALLLPYNSDYEIRKEELIIMNDTILGSGQFGLVLKGMIGPLPVAVKTIKPTADVIYFKSLLTELKILQYVGPHRNIVNLVGANTVNIRKREVYLILDFCSNGSLVEFLRRNRPRFIDFFHEGTSEEEKLPLYENAREVVLTTGNLIGFATEIASALDYLALKNVIHGDLAARNILVTEDLHAKICDFGLSKQLLHYTVYVQKIDCPLPLRWMALESLQDMEFSLASDKWSYGVVLWETFSLGELPYPGEQWSFASYQKLQEGYRMAKPKCANDEIYRLMLECWNSEPQERPSFQYVINRLKKEEEKLI